ncbi:MAG TPA: hypothetical protein VHT27_05935 [Solirubrobacteraceae bacterium]|jgi:hypothetical protein|nr:hypothetical protein [Solirubrobacteraceae bacterium]
MSAGPRPGTLAALLVGLYPEAWRERYGEEMLALVTDDPPGPRGLASLARGAVAAHLRPPAALRGPRTARMRLSLGALFACWLGLSLAGLAFQKMIENVPFNTPLRDASQRHELIAFSHGAVLAGALLGAAAIAVGGLPLLWLALRRAAAPGQSRLRALLALPPLALLAYAGLALVVFALAPERGQGFPLDWVLSAAVPMTLGAVLCVLVCAAVPRAVLRRIEPSARALRRAALAGIALAVAMWVVAAGIGVYALALWREAPALAAQTTGPFGASTGATLAANCAAALALTACGAIAATRAARAALTPA